ncbi:glycosyltransferase family 2 protein [Agrobacterium tumefaciens]|uniref:glycosyltransferase family 2 protein n=1 Tax=Agrobacterium tumefaciens TaxID=358 RepID=UPI001571C255|nr:glycosyltransferase family 2 protein [Agrobacterium tumefaciens]NSZ02205.1 glycosyltransferase family 2 protein [Agrobacterium tumefaciens]NSZ37088.1 glycosyltransferase family 2 protein [Agrobacterium tumefaciens]NTB26631.1 glycosyltransferase family 2 protein [Agrobacterium tumefaciens]NTB30372.1 glycosyltransferase family 2 protein [Agrobacterium tumefaciens]NTB32498.1 glycosyltransferase family 2 protein [Agrobacterium tumefaciens]
MTALPLSAVTVVSVCYKSDRLIRDFVSAIPEQTPIVLVDNGHSNTFADLPNDRNVTIVRLDSNLGFGRGCNAGADVARTAWVLFLNPDARPNPGAIEALLEAATRYPSAVAFNPRIYNGDGSPYFKRRSWLLPRSVYMKKGWPSEDVVVPVLSGAALFVSKKGFDRIGGFDPNIFMYHEDDDLSLRIAALGELRFVRNSTVVHSAGHSSGRSPEIARFKAYHMAQSKIYAGQKHNRPFSRTLTLLQGCLLLLSPQVLFSPRSRAKAFGFLQGALAKIWSEVLDAEPLGPQKGP